MEDLIRQQIEAVENRWEKNQRKREHVCSRVNSILSGHNVPWSEIDLPSRYRTRLERLGLHRDADAILDGASASFNPLERILRANELTGITFFSDGILKARSVGRIVIKNDRGSTVGFGTGFMISPQLIMTNNHVLADEQSASSSEIQFDYVTTQIGPREPVVFTLDPTSFFVTNSDLDFTIVAISNHGSNGMDASTRGWCRLIRSSGKATVGERVNIIQHPGGERMQIAVRANTIVSVVDDFLHYETDTMSGSSGSCVHNDQWELAALHHAGVPDKDEHGRIRLKDGSIWNGNRSDVHRIKWIANEGIRISSIVKHVDQIGLTSTMKAAWDEAFTDPPRSDIWDLFEGIHAHEKQPSQLTEERDEYGNPSWLFRLSFGPVESPPARAVTPNRSQTANLDEKPPTSNKKPHHNVDIRKVAQRIFEDFAVHGDYYNEDEDTLSRDEYYRTIELTSSAKELFPELSRLLRTTHVNVHSYSNARHQHLYPYIDLHEDGLLRNIYSGEPFNPVDAIASELSVLIPHAESLGYEVSGGSLAGLLTNEGLWDSVELNESLIPFNCEHVVCQSWFEKQQPMKADLHHLFACENRCNSFRNNIPYWQFPIEEEAFMEQCGRREGKNKFEPAEGKGTVARATMYFLVRYPSLIGDSAGELTKSRIDVLTKWHEENPVDQYEKHRNWLIQKTQGNRNPFIDFPDIVTKSLLEKGFGTR